MFLFDLSSIYFVTDDSLFSLLSNLSAFAVKTDMHPKRPYRANNCSSLTPVDRVAAATTGPTGAVQDVPRHSCYGMCFCFAMVYTCHNIAHHAPTPPRFLIFLDDSEDRIDQVRQLLASPRSLQPALARQCLERLGPIRDLQTVRTVFTSPLPPM